MDYIKLLVMSFFLWILCSCGSTSGSTFTTTAELTSVSKAVVYNYVAPGNSLPDIFYDETITLSGSTMNITRNGGSQINSGTWTIVLNNFELNKINDLLTLAVNPAVEDYINDTMVFDTQNSNLLIGDSKVFHYGMVIDPLSHKNQWHQFPIEATNLVSYIEELILAHVGSRYR